MASENQQEDVDALFPEHIGPYRVTGHLGKGGMGEVLRGYDERLDRPVALKRIRSTARDPEKALRRFRREAKALARLSHPAIVQVYDWEENDDQHWLVMELVDGQVLSDLMSAGPLPVARATAIAREVATGLAEAHETGLVHRDLKASNVVVTKGGAKILDFGLAKAVETDDMGAELMTRSLTQEGQIVGTISAMSPEQARGWRVDQRSDLFSLGSLLYEMLSGVHPFKGDSAAETLTRICTAQEEPLHALDPEIPEGLSRLVGQLLEKAPVHRPANARRVVSELERLNAPHVVSDSTELETSVYEGTTFADTEATSYEDTTLVDIEAAPAGEDAVLAEMVRAEAKMRASGQDTTELRKHIGELKHALLQEQREILALKHGDVLAGFELDEPIGQGGFATVWRALDEAHRVVAVKVLHSHYSANVSRKTRFFRGARAMARLDHRGIVRVLKPKAEESGHAFFVMEYLAGGDLRTAVLAGTLSREEGLRIIREVGEALSYAHRQGVIHRDVKPENILLDLEGCPRLTDFDLVRAFDTSGGTRTGTGLGTFIYAAPEALHAAAEVEASADVYGLGMTAAFVLHGQALPPVVMRDAPGFAAKLDVPTPWRAAITRAVKWEVENRWPSIEAFCQALGDTFEGQEQIFLWIDTPHDGRVELWRDIPAGEFWMGSPEGEGFDNEHPRHLVKVTNSFRISAVPVTNAQFAEFNPTKADMDRPNHPVVHVTWDDAMAFCDWLSKTFEWARGARLPTEEEWEYVARAGTATRYWSGDEESDLDRVGWYDKSSEMRSHTVGEKPANAWGLYDVHGNVWEWSLSGWDPKGYEKRAAEFAVDLAVIDVTSSGGERVIRGGSWINAAGWVRSAFRFFRDPGDEDWYRGFRVLLPSPRAGH